MKNDNGLSRKFRYGSISLGVTAIVIVAVLLFNVLASLLFGGNLWFVDLTQEPTRYTLTEEGKNLLTDTIASANEGRAENDPVTVDIIFCADPDMLYGNEMMRYVYITALQLQKEYADTIRVKTVNVWDNPSAVDAYRTNAYSSIYQSSVIVASGTEFRVYNPRSFYTYNEQDVDPWAYNIEKTFIKGILAVTRAEAPICAITVGHGEPFDPVTGETEYTELLKVIRKAGYDTVFVDLTKDELPEHCRLVVTFDPQSDFTSDFLSGGVSELSKLEKHLNNTYSYLLFVDADTPKLPNLEEFLEEWGIAFARKDKATYQIVDGKNSINSDGTAVLGQYAEGGFGADLTEDMRQFGEAPKVLFGNTLAINYSSTYERKPVQANPETGAKAYVTGYNYTNDCPRTIFDVFTASDTAFAYAKENGTRLTDEEDNPLVVDTQGGYRLMTITRQLRIQSEGKGYTNVYPNTYVCTVGSTDFASNEALSSNTYGNTDLLLSTLHTIGREIVSVGFDPIKLHQEEMNIKYYSEATNRVTTVILVALPAVIFAVTGVVVLVRRRVKR